ncbi:preprotein translocase subunit SecA [Aeromicrobium duanguangcaii]|uniref:Protein translocase subunit SecA n=1 Tax=Aeromicrobium duanguangcaii TaxID=2968086 RepID=A0ABY5KJK1_9ACTN|nr:preprotein translocase subunit SecA [Aeromicrobium duanguangcaii]MCD9153581.1 preprotein translocase subunit SecA [Aeromicrobium duanguangcaii]UUI70020.1 preprotein translocase subunit SecA [Aeromicrobium duanguangcaii]
MDSILRAGEGKILKRLDRIADQVNALSDEFAAMSDAELRAMTDEFKERLAGGESLDDLLPEAFATVREAASRVLGQRHFDVQLLGGAALHLGNIAEMKTGEGKTLVATLPSYLNALTGKGVHVVTVNDYLATYQSEMMGRVHHFLGLTVGVVVAGQTPAQRREAYACDITYGTNNEFGFDYLRDNMADSLDECVQRGHHFAIVDEVDSILIDEARTPLIISGPTEDEVKWYGEFARMIDAMRIDEHYEVDEKKRTVAVTEKAIDVVEDQLGIANLYDAVNTPLIGFLNNAVKAKELFKRDKDYVVIDGEVLIVDEHTGRLLEGRRYNEGLHQAIEAKEGVRIREEYQTLATITLQNYFRLYDKLSGMTGTAMTEAAEFDKIYKLGVVPIRTNKPVRRDDLPDLVYRTEDAKFNAVVDDIAERHEKGQPVLVGTTSVAKSERLSKMLKKKGIAHEVLNAKQHDREAAIVARAGHQGAVTVATNMAGRGTDIMLGGSVEFLADAELRSKGLDPVETPEEYEAAWPETLERIEKQVAAEKEQVIAAGGLAVIGTERHESRRIDNQLRGRSGRQGDPGLTRFYLSLEDDLMRLFKGEWVNWILQTMKIPDDVPIENKRVTKSIASAQGLVEAQNFETRKNILKYDDVMSAQREVVYSQRRRVLEGEDLEPRVRQMIEDVTGAYVTAATQGYSTTWELDKLWTALRTLYPISLEPDQVVDEVGGLERLDAPTLRKLVVEDALAAYDKREAELGNEVARELERRVVLSVLDRKWREHLYEMDYLREGIGLRAYSQRDPLVEYQREGYDLFNAMMEGISEESVGYLFNLSVEVEVEEGDDDDAPQIMAKGLEPDTTPKQLSYSAPSEDGSAIAVDESVEVDDDELDANEVARQNKAKEAARRKAKAARQSRKKNR